MKPIKTTGTTCDAFSARFESRHVFVKKLKEQHSSNSRYSIAFKKEYELGITLSHPSIPVYLKCSRDTLIIDFIDGKTLHQLIREDDPRLYIDRNIKKWVEQLLEVMDYLHARNVIHCDIKTDNIMITNETRNLMLIDFDKAYTASHDLTPGTPLNYGSDNEKLSKRQLDIRGVRNIIEKLQQYVDSPALKEKMEQVAAAACAPEVTIPELLETWGHSVSVQSADKTNSKKTYTGWWFGAAICIAILVIVWSYLPKRFSEVIQQKDDSILENPATTVPGEEPKEIIISNIEERKTEHTSGLPNWNTLLTTDVISMNKLLDEVAYKIQTDNIRPDSVSRIVLLITNEMNSFNNAVVKKYSSKFPDLGESKIMMGIYESEPVKAMAKRRDNIYQQLIAIQKQQSSTLKTEPTAGINDFSQSGFEKELEGDLAYYMNVLTQIDEVLNTTDVYPFDPINTKLKIQNMQIDFDNKILIKYPEKFPSLTSQECHDRAYRTPVVKRMVKLRDSIISRL